MEIKIQLKVCEGCGCLWFRVQGQASVYCNDCDVKLREYPEPETRKRRGRPCGKRQPAAAGWPTAAAMGGAE